MCVCFSVCVYTTETAPPVISGASQMQELTVALGQEVEFQCQVSGKPPPRVEWSRDGE